MESSGISAPFWISLAVRSSGSPSPERTTKYWCLLDVLHDALRQRSADRYLHSDQGSEYQPYAYFDSLKEHHIQASFGAKASPWQNGFQESFYSEFKKDLGHTARFEMLGELIEAIHLQIHYDNNERIHTVIKTIPVLYGQQLTTSDKAS